MNMLKYGILLFGLIFIISACTKEVEVPVEIEVPGPVQYINITLPCINNTTNNTTNEVSNITMCDDSNGGYSVKYVQGLIRQLSYLENWQNKQITNEINNTFYWENRTEYLEELVCDFNSSWEWC